MPVHNQIDRTELTNAMKALVGDTKSDGRVERFGETLTPIADLWSQPEFAWLRQEHLFGRVGAITAVAAEFCGAAIVNPADSGGLAVVYALVRAGVVTTFRWGLGVEATITATYAAGAAVNGIDSRRVPAGGAINLGAMQLPLRLFEGSDPGSVVAIAVDQVNAPAAADQDRFFRVPLILKPGIAAVVESTAVNQSGTTEFWGWFRKAKRGELP